MFDVSRGDRHRDIEYAPSVYISASLGEYRATGDGPYGVVNTPYPSEDVPNPRSGMPALSRAMEL